MTQSRELALLDQVPSYLQEYFGAEADNSEFAVPGGAPIASVSIKNRVFTLKMSGTEPFPIVDGNGYSAPFFDVVVIAANPHTTKTYYDTGYQDGDDSAPTCSSINGAVPDPGVPQPQAAYCNICDWNKFGSAPVGRGKACQDNKRLAIFPVWEGSPLDENEGYGGPMLLRVPPASFNNWDAYVKAVGKRGAHVAALVTRLSFDMTQTGSILKFEPIRFLEKAELDIVHKWRDEDHTERLLTLNTETAHEPAAAQPDSPDPAPAPSAPTPTARRTLPAASAPIGRPAPTAAAPAPAARPAPPAAAPARPRPAPAAAPQPAARPAPRPAPAPAGGGQRPAVAAPLAGRSFGTPRPAPAPAPAQAPAAAARPQPQRPAAAARPAPAAGSGNGRAAAPRRAPAPPPAQEVADIPIDDGLVLDGDDDSGFASAETSDILNAIDGIVEGLPE